VVLASRSKTRVEVFLSSFLVVAIDGWEKEKEEEKFEEG
jgi:hypothetical protein